MRIFRTQTGPFSERPYYSTEEVERMCVDELHKVGLFPSKPEPIRIERFIEKRFQFSPKYEDLPEGILGYTKYGPKGVEAIGISKALAEENKKSSERRINTSLAHEAGHGLLHTHLFAFGRPHKSLFGDALDPNELKILCRSESVFGKKATYKGQWWEYQANMAMSGLLLPQRLVAAAAEPYMVKVGSFGGRALDPNQREEAARSLAEIFDVNPAVVRIRLELMFPPGQDLQMAL